MTEWTRPDAALIRMSQAYFIVKTDLGTTYFGTSGVEVAPSLIESLVLYHVVQFYGIVLRIV